MAGRVSLRYQRLIGYYRGEACENRKRKGRCPGLLKGVCLGERCKTYRYYQALMTR